MATRAFRDMVESMLGENESVYLADGFEEAFVGIGWQASKPFAVYDRSECIKILMRDMSHEDAEEYFEFNVQGAYVGENTPVFMSKPSDVELN